MIPEAEGQLQVVCHLWRLNLHTRTGTQFPATDSWSPDPLGVVRRQQLRAREPLSYRDRRRQVERRRLDPLGLVLKAGSWYLVARADDKDRVYRVSRLQTLEVCDERFERPSDFDLAAFWARRREEFETSRPLVDVTVRVLAAAVDDLAQAIDFTVHPAVAGATPTEDPDWLKVVLPFERLEYAFAELIPLGGRVEVVGPPELRERLAKATRELAAAYG